MNEYVEMKNCYDYVVNGTWSSTTRKKYFDRCLQLLALYPELNKYYYTNEHAYHIKNRIHLRVDNTVKEKVIDMILDLPEEQIYSIDCLKIEPTEERFAGLYIVGDIKYDPVYGKVFLIKCGGSNDVGKRMKQYTTHNPMFFHDFTSLPCQDWEIREKTVQRFLARCAIGRPPVSREWFIVPEETYYKLCEYFKDTMFFTSIASGRWLF